MKTRALLLALPLVAVGCRDNGASVQIQQICFPPSDECVFSNRCDKVLIGNPRIEKGTTDGSLTLFLQVANQVQENADESTHRTNTNDAHVDEIHVEYEGVPAPPRMSFTNQRVPTNSTQVIEVVAAPAGFDGLFLTSAAQAIAVVTMRGYFDHGGRFETGEFPVAIDVCSNCVAPCAAGTLCGVSDGQEPKTCFDPGATSP